MISFSSLSKRPRATVAGIFSLALSSVLLLCGAGSAPVENFLPQGAMQGDLNAGGHSLTNAATVSATNVVVSGSLTAPTLGSLSGWSPTGIADASHYLRGDNTWALASGDYTLPNATTNSLGGVIVPATGGLSISTGTLTANFGAAASTIAQGNDSRIVGAAANATSHAGFLFASFQGYFLSGRERAVLLYSNDGMNFTQIRGLENYNPPTSGDGARDVDITKIGSTYYVAYSNVHGGTINGTGIASSPDLVNWTNVTTTSGSQAVASPKWFTDPANGNIYVVGYNQIMQNTSGDGATWGTPSTFAFSDGTAPNTGDDFLLKSGSTYGLFYCTTAAANVYRIGTSSSLASGYTDQGAITGWPSAEGIDVFLDASGTYWAYFNARSGTYIGQTLVSKSTTPLVPSSWSTPVVIGGPNSTPMAVNTDNGGGFCISDLATMRDVTSALLGENLFNSNGPDLSPGFQFPYGLQVSSAGTQYAGTGTIAISGNIITGTGTLFTHQLKRGSVLCDSTGTYRSLVGSIASDTSLTVIPVYGLNAWPSGSSFLYSPPAAIFGSDPSSLVNAAYVAGKSSNNNDGTPLVFDNGGLIFYGKTSGIAWNDSIDNSGNISLHNSNGNILTINVAAFPGTIQAVANGIQSVRSLISDGVGYGLQVKEGSNAKQGTAILAGGTVTVSDTSVTSTSRIFLTTQTPGGTVGTPYVSARSAGVSFTITSTSGSDTSTVAYEIFESAP